jgi:hypothetical protein
MIQQAQRDSVYGRHYQVVWIETVEPWHPSRDDLPAEFTIAGTLQGDLTSDTADALALVANLDSDLLHRNGRWAIVAPSGVF